MIIIEERINLFKIQIKQSIEEENCVYRSRINDITIEAKQYVEKRIGINQIDRINFPLVMHLAMRGHDFLREIDERNGLTNRELQHLIDLLV